MADGDNTTPDSSNNPDQLQGNVNIQVTSGDASGVDAPATAEGGSPVDTIVNTLKFGWDVMKDNRPVANASSDTANAVPQGVNFTDITGWNSDPRQLTLRYTFTNHLGMDTVSLDITVLWYFNGNVNGAGQYINNATVYCTGDVGWGQTINITASVANPMNDGTRIAPVAVLPITIRIQQSNFFQNLSTVYLGRISGNGAGTLRDAG